uniref:Alternative protein HERC2 n=1 Tax=Homo sapiens TaxID=9606 RepID=L8E7P5_HUMAN|nr:alternative protein HERC2 [Homo sapiens]
MDQMTMFEGLGRSKGCRGRKSSPSPLAPCTVCAAQRMVRFIHGATMMRDNWETEPPMPSRGLGW